MEIRFTVVFLSVGFIGNLILLSFGFWLDHSQPDLEKAITGYFEEPVFCKNSPLTDIQEEACQQSSKRKQSELLKAIYPFVLVIGSYLIGLSVFRKWDDLANELLKEKHQGLEIGKRIGVLFYIPSVIGWILGFSSVFVSFEGETRRVFWPMERNFPKKGVSIAMIPFSLGFKKAWIGIRSQPHLLVMKPGST